MQIVITVKNDAMVNTFTPNKRNIINRTKDELKNEKFILIFAFQASFSRKKLWLETKMPISGNGSFRSGCMSLLYFRGAPL